MKELIQIRNYAITKRLNFLVGSGASVPAIPLMGNFKYDKDGTLVEDSIANQQLENRISQVSRYLVDYNAGFRLFLNKVEDEGELYTIDYYKKLYKFYSDCNQINHVSKKYSRFIETIIGLLYISNSRQTTKNINIFTTNYDLFIEKSVDKLMKVDKFIFNDGTNGYFERVLDSSNYNKTVAYRGLNDNYLNELPSISLIKPHGSMNWEKRQDESIVIKQSVVDNPVIVKPTGLEGQETFLNNHFHEMLRIFQLELDKPQSVLIVIGFSFQDKHIAKMLVRALQNPEIIIYIFGYTDRDRETILNNLSLESELRNLKIITPKDIQDNTLKTLNETDGKEWFSFTIENLIDLLNSPSANKKRGDEDL